MLKADIAGLRKKIFTRYVFILIAGLAVAAAAAPTLWAKNVYVMHSILELICIFISLSTFLIVWNTYEEPLSPNHIIGFGFLAVAVFNSFHAYYFFAVRTLNQGYSDLSTRYWVIGKLIEVFVLIAMSMKVKRFFLNKWLSLILTISLSMAVSLAVLYFPEILPVMLMVDGPTPVKIAIGYIVIILTAICLYSLRNSLDDNSVISYRHIYMALLLTIPAELFFTMFKVVTSFCHAYGHVIKIMYYYYLYKAVFVSAVTSPYKRLEEERKELEEKNSEVTSLSETLGDLLDALPIGILYYNAYGRLKYVNKKFEEMHECDRNSLYGLNAKEIRSMLKGLTYMDQTIYDITLRNGRGIDRLVETLVTLKGNPIKVSLTSRKVKNGVIILINDARKEQELENLQLQTQTILNAIENLVVIVDKENKILMCNRAYESITGVSAKDITGMNLDVHRTLLNTHIENEYEQNSGENINKTFEASFITAYGQEKRLLYTSSPIHNIDNEVIGGITVASDITDLRERQEKMMEQEKLALLGQLGAGIVHETRNYLTVIKGSCQLINMLTEEEKVKKYAGLIDKNINEINRIIGDFLSLSKIREAEFQEVSMYDIIHSIKSIVETSSLTKDIDVEFCSSKDERYLLCDEGHIKQVVLNMCKNAIDAMNNIKNPKLKIETGYSEETNEMHISISDNGHGIPENIFSKVGTPFFTTKTTGTGLGLSVCYRIVKEHNGRIDIESKPEEGSKFTIILPCIEDDEELEEII